MSAWSVSLAASTPAFVDRYATIMDLKAVERATIALMDLARRCQPEVVQLLEQSLEFERAGLRSTHQGTVSTLRAFARGIASQDEPIRMLTRQTNGQRQAVIAASLVVAARVDTSRVLRLIARAVDPGSSSTNILLFPTKRPDR